MVADLNPATCMDICHLVWLRTRKGVPYSLFNFFLVKNDPDLDFARTQTMVGRCSTLSSEICIPVLVF